MQAAPLTAISKMQYLDPEELLMDEEDDVFGEGKHVSSGRSLSDRLLSSDTVGNF